MLDSKQAPPACIYLLSDHLDAILAAGEDLLATSAELIALAPAGGLAELRERHETIAAFLNRLRTLEATLVARVLQARRRAEEIPKGDAHTKPLVSLFLSGTIVLLDAVAEFGDPSGLAFNSGADGLHFLRTRGLLAQDAADLPLTGTLVADEDYLVVGRVRLGSLLDLVATFLDALDMRFSLYQADEIPAELERYIDTPALHVTPNASAKTEEPGTKARSLQAALDALYGPS